MNDSRLLISRQCLLHNLRLIRRSVARGTKICAIVKADAYGHGAEILADTLANFALNGAAVPAVDTFAVATIDEAADLPDTGVPVLVLRPVENVYLNGHREALEAAIRAGFHLTLISASAADDVARIAMSCGRRASVHVMIDTGMFRCGAPVSSAAALLEKIESHSALRLAGLGTHFACADRRGSEFTDEQLERFRAATDAFVAARPGKVLRHAANTGAIFFCPASHLDMVRPGIGMYGIDPSARPNLDRPLRPAMKWVAPLLAIHDVPRGASIGYGQTWTADRDTRVGVVPVGYADGYPLAASGRGVMMLAGRALRVAGRVSMDYTMIELPGDLAVSIGDEITVLDSDPLSPASVYALADHAATIPYEILTRIGRRVARVAVEPSDLPVSLAARPIG